MKRPFLIVPPLVAAILAGVVLLAGSAHAQTVTQPVTLSAGWNAVWLEVEPAYDTGPNAGQPKAPQDVFANAAIQVIATPKPLAGLAEFFSAAPFGTDTGTSGSAPVFNQDGWQQWNKTDTAGINNLPLVYGNHPYLIQVAAGTATFSLPITGKAHFFRPTWTPDRYNLVGFGLDGTPTFTAFFGPSGTTHPIAKLFRLNAATGAWQHVAASDTMRSGEAYWVFSAGPSTYMGPVAVDFDQAITGQLNFGGPADAVPVGTGVDALELDLKEVAFTNLGSAAASPGLDLIAASPGPGSLALYTVNPNTSNLGYTRGNQVDSSPGAGAGASLGETVTPQMTATLTLGARRTGTFGAGGRTHLYRLKTGAGSLFWLPVNATDNDTPAAAAAVQATTNPVTGLWVGDISVDAVTSIVVNGSPTQPAAGSTPLRILLHCAADGSVRLLSQVTIMQTKTADPAALPVPVLVVDPARIPFFEGVKDRNGKLAGLRLEAVAYDMPRDTSLAAQSESPVTAASDDLIDMIVAESTSPATTWTAGAGRYANRAAVDSAAINAYLLFRGIRPPALKEKYLPTLPLSGSLGAGQTVQTHPNTLTLDPFHRSNPFRHAYHPNHSKGPSITRELTLVFDPTQDLAERLRGTYSETVKGLIKTNLTLTGRFDLHRVNAVATLEGAQ